MAWNTWMKLDNSRLLKHVSRRHSDHMWMSCCSYWFLSVPRSNFTSSDYVAVSISLLNEFHAKLSHYWSLVSRWIFNNYRPFSWIFEFSSIQLNVTKPRLEGRYSLVPFLYKYRHWIFVLDINMHCCCWKQGSRPRWRHSDNCYLELDHSWLLINFLRLEDWEFVVSRSNHELLVVVMPWTSNYSK